jgi:hypothetical protein
MVSGISGGTADFTFGAGRFAPGTLFGLRVIESKVLAAPVVMDSSANGKLYLSPISLARFEENAGRTNTSLGPTRGARCIRRRAHGCGHSDRLELDAAR